MNLNSKNSGLAHISMAVFNPAVRTSGQIASGRGLESQFDHTYLSFYSKRGNTLKVWKAPNNRAKQAV
jgi:hypothetical protein